MSERKIDTDDEAIYIEIKRGDKDGILFYCLGNFYEMSFCDVFL